MDIANIQNNQSNSPACPQLLGLHCISQSTFCSFGFILTCATGVTPANDKSDLNSHGFSINKFCADSSIWQAGNFVIAKHFKLLKVTMFTTGARGKDTLPESEDTIRSALYGGGIAAGLPGATLPSLTQPTRPAMEAAEVRVGTTLDATVVGGQKTAAWALRGGSLAGQAPIAAPTSTAPLGPRFNPTGFKEKGVGITLLTKRSSLQGSLLGQN